MSKFKAGDKVKRTAGGSHEEYGMFIGKTYTVSHYRMCGMEVEEIKGVYWEGYNFELVEEPTPFGKSLFGYKIKVKDEEQFRLINEAVVDAGGKWLCGNRFTDWIAAYNYIYIGLDGSMSRGSGSEEDKSCWPTLLLETVKTLRIVDIIPVKTQAEIEKENLQKVIDKLQQDLDNAKQQLNNVGGK